MVDDILICFYIQLSSIKDIYMYVFQESWLYCVFVWFCVRGLLAL